MARHDEPTVEAAAWQLPTVASAGHAATVPAAGTGDAATVPAAGAPTAAGELPRGVAAGRYVVLDRLGEGGMGVVYAAYDPELDRKVALKILRTGSGAEGSGAGRARGRLLHEAQTMARLAHPNVVPVHDVGTIDGQVFIAMAHVDGRSLSAWLDERPRSLAEVIEVFAAAGRGLAAAHAAGIVHRDFKPDNVLVSRTGEIRVADFGVAHTMADAERAVAVVAASPAGAVANALMTASSGTLAASITRTGTMVGTPAYMAPEQLAGEPTGPETDQFSFCVALHEALYRTRPFEGSTLPELAAEVMGGRVKPAPPGSSVPGWLRRVLLRGLSPRRADRFPSMRALLAALERPSAVRRRSWLLRGTAAGAICALALGFAVARSQGAARCQGARGKLGGVWDAARKSAVRAAFLATGAPYAADSWAATERALDQHSAAWVAAHTEACEATALRGQPAAMLDRRMACLDRRLEEMRATTTVLAAANDRVVERAVATATGLASLAPCSDLAALAAAVPPPEDRATAERVNALRPGLAEASALEVAGKYEEALARSRPIAAEARALPYLPFRAEAVYQLASLLDNTGDHKGAEAMMLEAVWAAEASREDELAATIWSRLVYIAGYVDKRFADGRQWMARAQAALARIGSPPIDEADYLTSAAMLHQAAGELSEALAAQERAHALRLKYLRPDHFDIPRSFTNLGLVLHKLGRYDEAGADFQRALEMRQKALGPNHPDVALSLMNVGMLASAQGRSAVAIDRYREALAIQEKQRVPNRAVIMRTLVNLGNTLQESNRDDEAVAALRRAVDAGESVFGADHPDVADALDGLGAALIKKHALDDAETALSRALVIRQKVLGPTHMDVGYSMMNLGDLYAKRHEPARAREQFRQLLVLWEKQLGPDHPLLSVPLINLGELAREAHKPAQAVAPLDRAVTLLEVSHGDDRGLQIARFALAQALWDSGGDRRRARSLAEKVRDAQAAGGKPDPELVTWLARHLA